MSAEQSIKYTKQRRVSKRPGPNSSIAKLLGAKTLTLRLRLANMKLTHVMPFQRIHPSQPSALECRILMQRHSEGTSTLEYSKSGETKVDMLLMVQKSCRPVEVGSSSHYMQRFFTSLMVQDFFNFFLQQYDIVHAGVCG